MRIAQLQHRITSFRTGQVPQSTTYLDIQAEVDNAEAVLRYSEAAVAFMVERNQEVNCKTATSACSKSFKNRQIEISCMLSFFSMLKYFDSSHYF